jgi:long-chain acyl-CoA synthetase
MYFAKPHLFMGVPRIFHRVADGIKAKFDNMGSYSKKLINWAYQAKLNKLERTGSYNSCFFDKIFFSAIKDAFGGRLKLIISGGAPIKPETYQFMKVVTSTPMTEGYGLT